MNSILNLICPRELIEGAGEKMPAEKVSASPVGLQQGGTPVA